MHVVSFSRFICPMEFFAKLAKTIKQARIFRIFLIILIVPMVLFYQEYRLLSGISIMISHCLKGY